MASNSAAASLASEIQALTFDVFGTVVDWRSSVEAELRRLAESKINSAGFRSLPETLQNRVEQLTAEDWARFAAEWRARYGSFTQSFVPGESQWKDIDTHHHESLVELLDQWQLSGLYAEHEVAELSRVWHRLQPWPDSSQGLHMLGQRFTTATLSNGNRSLLRDLDEFGNLGFKTIISAADFGAYKPHPEVYLGAARTLGLRPQQVAMVAAHLGDLEAARSQGMRTVYVERPGEEAWGAGEERHQRARAWVDVWVSQGEQGFVQAARRLGLS